MPAQPCARLRACAPAFRRSSKAACQLAPLILGVALAGLAPRAHAQVSGVISVESDYRAHGYSLTGNEPAVSAQISYDHRSGLYGSATVIGSINDYNHPDLAGAIGNIGFAQEVKPGLSLDGGYLHTYYRQHNYVRHRDTFQDDEFYVGAVYHGFAYHAYVSPNYLSFPVTTLYHEAAGSIALPGKLQLTGRAGLLLYLHAPPQWHLTHDYDWSVGLTRPVGRVSLNLSLDGGRSDLVRFYQIKKLDGTRVVGGISIAF